MDCGSATSHFVFPVNKGCFSSQAAWMNAGQVNSSSALALHSWESRGSELLPTPDSSSALLQGHYSREQGWGHAEHVETFSQAPPG